MTGDSLTWFWGVVGLIVAFGLVYFGARAWSSKQSQKIDRGGIGIQAGGNVKISAQDSDTDDKK